MAAQEKKRQSAPAYCTFSAFEKTLVLAREKKPKYFNTDFLIEYGMSKSTAASVIRALHFLSLIDVNHQLTDVGSDLMLDQDIKQPLGRALATAYAPMLLNGDLDGASRSTIAINFERTFSTRGSTTRRATTFLLKAMESVGWSFADLHKSSKVDLPTEDWKNLILDHIQQLDINRSQVQDRLEAIEEQTGPRSTDDLAERIERLESAIEDLASNLAEPDLFGTILEREDISTIIQENVRSALKQSEIVEEVLDTIRQEIRGLSDEYGDVMANKLAKEDFSLAVANPEQQAEEQLVESLLSDPPIRDDIERLRDIDHLRGGLDQLIQEEVNPELEDLVEKEVDRRLEKRNPRPDIFWRTESRIRDAQIKGERLHHRPFNVTLTPDKLVEKLEKQGFYLAVSTARKIARYIESTRLVVLQGPPGTGKSKLAKLLPRLFLRSAENTESIVTLSPDMSEEDMIIGQSYLDGHFGVDLGFLVEAVIKAIETDGNHWLILDEINRADISRLLTPVLDGLETGQIHCRKLFPDKLETGGKLLMPSSFRILGTMNTMDADQLFKFSEALLRRIRFVSLDALPDAKLLTLATEQVYRPLLRRFGETRESLPHFRARIGIESLEGLVIRTVSGIRSLRARAPVSAYKQSDVGPAIILELLDFLVRDLCKPATADSPDLQSFVDRAFRFVLLESFRNCGFEMFTALRDEVFDRNAFPVSWSFVTEKLEEFDVF